MEMTFASSAARWLHEETKGIRVKRVEPTSETDPPRMETEEIILDTVVLFEPGSEDVKVFKFSFDKDRLAEFLGDFVEHLDTDGRKLLRDKLEESSGLVIPEVSTRHLKLVDKD